MDSPAAGHGANRRRAALVTGFEPFASHRLNPSAEIARRLDGVAICGTPVVGRVLPVDLGRLESEIDRILDHVEPAAVVNLGLSAGEPVVCLERVAFNLAAFEVPDNAGRRPAGEPLDPDGPAALWSRLDLAAIRAALLAVGIPVRLSNSAGTYLCNAAMYRFLRRVPPDVPCGFIHVPFLRAQVAEMIERDGPAGEPGRMASMEFPTLRRAVEIALETELARAVPAAAASP